MSSNTRVTQNEDLAASAVMLLSVMETITTQREAQKPPTQSEQSSQWDISEWTGAWASKPPKRPRKGNPEPAASASSTSMPRLKSSADLFSCPADCKKCKPTTIPPSSAPSSNSSSSTSITSLASVSTTSATNTTLTSPEPIVPTLNPPQSPLLMPISPTNPYIIAETAHHTLRNTNTKTSIQTMIDETLTILNLTSRGQREWEEDVIWRWEDDVPESKGKDNKAVFNQRARNRHRLEGTFVVIGRKGRRVVIGGCKGWIL